MRHPFAPTSRSLALEPRILFDAAAGAAVDHQQGEHADAAHASPQQSTADTAPRQILAVDSRISGAQSLATNAKPNSIVVLVEAGQDGMAAISAALQQAGKVDSIQILGHGADGQMRLGSSSLSANSADTARASGWSANLTASADILIYGCRTGAGEAGAALIERLAALTGADVAASTDDTGSMRVGGDWDLERQSGVIESSLAVSADALSGYNGLMADASPTVTLSAAALETVLGDQLTFTATFTNPANQAGYAPFIDLLLPATGKDGAGAEIDDGITFVSATYLGQAVTAYTITFDASGNAMHPLAKDSSGQPVIVNAATYGARAGDQLVVLQLPYASVLNSQPPIDIVITAQLSNLADTTGSPALTITARGGFQFGNDPADNPVSDPSLIEASTQTLVVNPSGLKLTQAINMPEGETVTGPNFARTVTVTATPPPGQTLTNVDISQTLPGELRYVSITPAAGGELISITLANGNVITEPGLIPQILAVSPYLSGYTVRYASMSAPTVTLVRFYVPEQNAAGNDVLDPVTGDDREITFGAPTASAEWVPLDPRDQIVIDPGPPPVTEPTIVTASGGEQSFIAKSVALVKSVAIINNTGAVGLSPGDELQYSLNVDLSDYFAIGKTLFNVGNLTITDELGDGQSLTGTPLLTIFFEGSQYNIALVSSSVVDANTGVTTLTFDIAQSLANTTAISGGALIGDIAFDGTLEGPTRAVITYRSTVGQAYTTVYPQSEINEGDSVGNNAEVSGTLLANNILLTGFTETDDSQASLRVPTNTVATSILTVNGGAPPADVELKPGDVVTFKLAYDLTTGDYEDFKLTAFLPLPLFDLTGINWTQGSGTGQWDYGSGDTNDDSVDAVTVGAGNSLLFEFGDHTTGDLNGKRIEVQFTLTVGNQPFGDNRPLTVLGQSDQLTTIPVQQHLVSSGVVNIASVAEPVLAITHGVVAVGVGSAGIVSGTSGSWAAAGSTGKPFNGSITDLAAVDGSVINIDGADLVRLATAIENSGGLGAFDVATTISLPAGFSFVGGSLATANLAIYRGDGTALILGTDYSVLGSAITFLDAAGQPTLLAGRAGTDADISGANLVVITYDVVASVSIAASESLQTSSALTNYSSADGGPDFTPGANPQDIANQNVAAPVIIKVFANGTLSNDDSSASHTKGADLVIGESMLYDIVVTLPEGTTQNLRINDLIPAGMTLDASFGNGGYEVLTTTAGSGALATDFVGSVIVGNASAPGGDGADLALVLSAAAATADNAVANNSFVVRVRLIASNVSGNQAGASRSNSAEMLYSDPDGDTPNGSTASDRTVALSGTQPGIVVREPTLTVTQTQTNNGGALGVDRNDIITYTITISNGNSGSDFDAFDIAFSDVAPAQLSFQNPGYSVTYAGGATNNGGADFVLNTILNTLTTVANANIDIPKGGSITITVDGRVKSDLGSVLDITNTAEVQWTSLNGTTNTAATGERSGVDGLLDSGALNDYRYSNTITVPVAAGATISHVGLLSDTPAPSPNTSRPETVAVGELIYYRVAFLVPEGDTDDASVVVNLPTGLSFAGDTRVALVDGGTPLVSSDVVLSANPGAVQVDQDITDIAQSLLAEDLSNAATATMRAALIDTSNPGAIRFSLGNVNNGNNDAFLQMIYLDFFVRVDNIADVDTADNFNVTADFFSGALKQTSTPVAVEQILEPDLRDLQKTVTDFNPNTGGATGTATVTLAFSNTGDGIAYDAHMTDIVTGGFNYGLSAVVINGTSYGAGNLPAGIAVSTAGGITADFSTVAIGSSIELVYTVDVPNGAAIASTNATLNWSSLPETFTDGSAVVGGGSVTVGSDGTPSGERDDGDSTVPNTAPNTYVVSEGAGLGIITGTLWDDTGNPTDGLTPGGTRLANQTVTLTWAGADGDLATLGDNRAFTAITDAAGNYRFGVLPSGNFRIDTVNPVNNYVFGGDTDNAAVRIDSDGGTLGRVTVNALGEGATRSAVFGYVRDNDAPVNTLPASPTTLEDAPLNITGISVADIDASNNNLTVTLSVMHGTLNLTSLVDVSIDAGALDSATVTIKGTIDKLNAALQSLVYTPALNYNGTDTLTMTTSDLGSTGDANGNLMPNEAADALTDTDQLIINITPVNDTPIALNDVMLAIEQGGVNNSVGGLVGAAAVLKNDIDVDIATNGDSLSVTKIGFGDAPPTTVVGFGFAAQAGVYGELFINAGGNARYVVDNNNATVQALRLSGNTLTEVFTYELSDEGGLKSTATITVTIQGANDTPVGVNDEGAVYEAGGVNNGTPGGIPVLPTVLDNDTDVDLNGETKNVSGIRYRRESASAGSFTGVDATTPGVVTGKFGTLTMNYDGSYDYVVDQTATLVERMVAGDKLVEYFSYMVTDALGDTDIAEIKITINGANDNPVASDDEAEAQAASTNGNAQEVSPIGNVITAQSRPGTIDQPGGNGIDTDVDRTDRPNSNLQIDGIRIGVEAQGDTTTSVNGATTVPGNFGILTINPDGSFSYDVDSSNAMLLALMPGQTVTESFTYRVVDTAGLTDLAELNITVYGVNDPPVANDVYAVAVEAGGVANAIAGMNPVGDATDNDFDSDGDTITIIGARTGTEPGGGSDTPIPDGGSIILTGDYGDLTLNSDGSYSYALNNDSSDVQALRSNRDTLTDTFTYTLSDNTTPAPETDQAQIVVTIEGRNDNPIGNDDAATAVEAGGVGNMTPGINPTGNVLGNDTDVDSAANGETKQVSAVRTGTELGGGSAGAIGSAFAGTYGSLTLNEDGSYEYVIDNTDAAVQALRLVTDTLTETFTYTVSDTDGASDLAQLTITIRGANDDPTAFADTAMAAEAGGLNNTVPGSDATGDVLQNDTDVDAGDSKAVTVFDGAGSDSGTAGGSATGSYGTLQLDADGRYTYVVDNANRQVQALRTSSDTLTDIFTYTVRDSAGATSSTTLSVTVSGANDNPVANNDAGTAVEAGGLNNMTPGRDAIGDVLLNDTDVDGVAFGETKQVATVRTGTEAGGGTAGTVGIELTGTYGALTLKADGSYTYVVDNTDPAVQALRTSADTLSDTFTYTVRDKDGATDIAELTITIQGANDTPVAADDVGSAIEAGGSFNGTPGGNGSGNVLTNDTDIDTADGKAVTAVTGSADGVIGGSTPGAYGSLLLDADGTYTYVVDDNNAAVQALRLITDTLTDTFTYTVRDTAGLTDTAVLTITLQGANDTPVAVNDAATAVEAGGVGNMTPGINPTGNVLGNDTDVDSAANGETKQVSAVRTGTELGGGSAGAIGSAFAGTYGSLTLNEDGSYEYVIDNTDAAVQALRLVTDTLTETFTYTVSDTDGASDLAQLTITIRGANDDPTAFADTAMAAEAGGLNNTVPGSDATGDVLQNDTDVDAGDSKAVTVFDGAGSDSGTAGGSATGSYGTLQLDADGRYTYVVDNANRQVQALRTSSDTLTDIFTYTVRDSAGATSSTTLSVTVSGANDNPVANNDAGTAVEAGGLNNMTPGRDAIGDVLLNDTDVDGVAFGETKQVATVRTGTEAGGGTAGTVGIELTGTYGALTLKADGSYTYVVDNTDPAVQALRTSADTLSDTFTYTVRDKDGATDIAELTITIQGANDTPVAADDVGSAIEAGGSFNGTPGGNGSGNVLTNDTDIDTADGKAVTAVTGSADGVIGGSTPGAYGSLLLDADGTYTYVVDDNNAAVQALRLITDTLTDTFTYTVRDTAGLTDTAVLTITLQGANDTPVAVNDAATAVEAGGVGNMTPGSNGTGNVLTNDTDVDAGDSKTVTAIRSGAESDTGAVGAVGGTILGRYGSLTWNADGSYNYVVDNGNLAVDTLRTRGETLTESFTYRVKDALGATDSAQLDIVIRGANDTPLARDDSGFATDVSGPAVTSGNVLPNDSDVDSGDARTVTAIRAGEESGSGASGVVGQTLQGSYGFLVINADGSYTYRVDTSNPDVNRALGLGPVLKDVFTYTVTDRGGASDQAQLTITIDMMAPFVGLGDRWGGDSYRHDPRADDTYRLGLDPVTFVTQAVREVELLLNLSSSETGGEKLRLVLPPEISLISQAAGLGLYDDPTLRSLLGIRAGAISNPISDTANGQLLRPTLRFLEILNRFEKSKVIGREGVVSLSADGLLPEISVFSAEIPAKVNERPHNNPAAASFSQQLQQLGSKPGKSLPAARPAN